MKNRNQVKILFTAAETLLCARLGKYRGKYHTTQTDPSIRPTHHTPRNIPRCASLARSCCCSSGSRRLLCRRPVHAALLKEGWIAVCPDARRQHTKVREDGLSRVRLFADMLKNRDESASSGVCIPPLSNEHLHCASLIAPFRGLGGRLSYAQNVSAALPMIAVRVAQQLCRFQNIRTCLDKSIK